MRSAVSAGSAKISESDVARIAKQKSGSRLNDIPGARFLKMVTTRFAAPIVVEMPVKISASA
jgi:hypothetical protein